VKLVSSIQRLESGRRKRRRQLAVIWSADELKLGRPLAEGELLATDLCCVVPERPAGDPDDGPLPSVITQSRERATRDPLDLGDVYDGAGVVVGKVWDVVVCASSSGRVSYYYTCPVEDAPALRAQPGGHGAMSHGSGRR
jgi:hypothetical protein